ncbi:MAG: hypothetical protein RLZZ455_716 [Candidatus Parcubacteria bacterium]|jgi:glucose/arabinose dehydrogenase
MKTIISLLIGIVIITLLLVGFAEFQASKPPAKRLTQSSPTPDSQEVVANPVTTIATGLSTPWALAFLPDGDLLVTERDGTVKIIRKTTGLDDAPLLTIDDVKQIGEGGLMGIAIHPSFPQKPYIYFDYTYSQNGSNTANRVVRYTFKNNRFSDKKIIVDAIPGAANHNGGRIKFGPDGYLYITTGDSEAPSLAQSATSLAGKILRIDENGNAAKGNPFTGTFGTPQSRNNLVYSLGHRNPQGIAWDSEGNLWETEHGRSLPSGLDEINLIEYGKNYGWPTIQGDENKDGLITPVKSSGVSTTWAPSGAVFFGDSLFFTGLRGQTLYEAVIKNNTVTEIKEHFKGTFGRLREVILGPDGMLYITTSNRDGRGIPSAEDDRVIKINPENL